MVKKKLFVIGALAIALVAMGIAPSAVKADQKDESSVDGTMKDGALTSETNINVRTISDAAKYIYSVKIVYGDMNFTYDYGSHWNPETHSYDGANGNAIGWRSTDWNGDNNKITVTNDSNYPVNIKLDSDLGTSLNSNKTKNGYVIGVFAYQNTDITGGTIKMNGSASGYNTTNQGVMSKSFDLDIDDTAAWDSGANAYRTDFGYFATLNANDTNKGNRKDASSKAVYFGLSGTPDAGLKLGSDSTYAPVGKITVTIKPANAANVTDH